MLRGCVVGGTFGACKKDGGGGAGGERAVRCGVASNAPLEGFVLPATMALVLAVVGTENELSTEDYVVEALAFLVIRSEDDRVSCLC